MVGYVTEKSYNPMGTLYGEVAGTGTATTLKVGELVGTMELGMVEKTIVASKKHNSKIDDENSSLDTTLVTVPDKKSIDLGTNPTTSLKTGSSPTKFAVMVDTKKSPGAELQPPRELGPHRVGAQDQTRPAGVDTTKIAPPKNLRLNGMAAALLSKLVVYRVSPRLPPVGGGNALLTTDLNDTKVIAGASDVSKGGKEISDRTESGLMSCPVTFAVVVSGKSACPAGSGPSF